MVSIALDGVEGCWLDDGAKASLRERVRDAAVELAPVADD
jgi:hypothetical protein